MDEHVAKLNKVDPKYKFEIFVTKWKRISEVVMNIIILNICKMV
jgi:hypothetical protein